MQRQIIYYCFQDPERKPPCLTEMYQLSDKGYHVVLVSFFCRGEFAAALKKKRIRCVCPRLSESHNILKRKLYNYMVYKNTWKYVFDKIWTDDSVLWIGTEMSAFKSRLFLRGRHPVIQNALEFYEQSSWQRKMKKIAAEADVLTACEPHRAQYMKRWWHLKEMPFVLRNKPYDHPEKLRLKAGSEQVQEAIDRMSGKKILMYQGAIETDRDLTLLAAALQKAGSDYWLTLSGIVKDDTLHKIEKSYDKVLYLGNIPHEHFLEVTSYAHICVAFYKDNCINNRYCAPNKIYEYTGFGIPVLCNNIPGLETTIGQAGAGICVNFRDSEAVIRAIEKIDANYDHYCANAKRFYDETDNTVVLDSILEKAFALTKKERLKS